MREVALSIKNETVPACDAATFEQTNPVSHDFVTRVAVASVEDAKHAANVISSTFPTWSSATAETRRELLNCTANLLLSRADDVTDLRGITIRGGPQRYPT